MTDRTWSAAGAGNASVAGNWSPSGVPGASDNAIFNDSASSENCNWNVSADIGKITVASGGYTGQLVIAGNLTGLTEFEFNMEVLVGSAFSMSFAGSPTASSGRFIDIGSAASISSASRAYLTFNIDNGSGSEVFFDKGTYPNVALVSGQFSPHYSAPTDSDNTSVKFNNFAVTSSAVVTPTGLADDDDRDMVFQLDGVFVCEASGFNGGEAEWVFQGQKVSPGPVPFFPVSGDSTNFGGATFEAFFKKITADATTNGVGSIMAIQTGCLLTVEELKVNVGCSLISAGTSTIVCTKRPQINGTWGFTQIASGIYISEGKFLLGEYNGGTGLTTLPHTAHISLSISVSSFTSGAYTICPLNTSDFDTAGAWDNTNNYYVAPRTGKYLVSYSTAMRHISTSQVCIAALYKEAVGAIVDATFRGSSISKATYGKDSAEPSGGTILLSLTTGDRVALYCYHNGGSGKNLVGDAVSEGITFLSIAEMLA